MQQNVECQKDATENTIAWELFKSSIKMDVKAGIFPPSADLGNCSVTVSHIKGKLYLEIIPSETAQFEDDIAGVIVEVDEAYLNTDAIMSMAANAAQVEKAKQNRRPIKVFNPRPPMPVDKL